MLPVPKRGQDGWLSPYREFLDRRGIIHSVRRKLDPVAKLVSHALEHSPWPKRTSQPPCQALWYLAHAVEYRVRKSDLRKLIRFIRHPFDWPAPICKECARLATAAEKGLSR